MEQYKQFQRDQAFLNNQREQLTSQHPEQWVAIYNEEVVAIAGSQEDLWAELGNKNISKNLIACDRMKMTPL